MKCQCGCNVNISFWGLLQNCVYYPPAKQKDGNRPSLLPVNLYSCPECGLVYNQLNTKNM